MYSYPEMAHSNKDTMTMSPRTTSPHDDVTGVSDETSVAEYSERLTHLTNKCSITKSLPEKTTYRGGLMYYLSKEYNFTYCKVPKAGCTFMLQTLAILKYGTDNKDAILSKPRIMVHIDYQIFLVPFDSAERQQSRTVIITRNPFSRLLSGYIDKVSTLMMPKVFNKLLFRSSGKSADLSSASDYSSVTFEAFLRFIIDSVRYGGVLDGHWTPISHLCQPCVVNTYFIIRQESYSKDMTNFLKTLGVGHETLDVIHEAMNEQRAVTSLPGILAIMYSGIHDNSSKSQLVHRLGLGELHRRVWSALQMQGYINDELKFSAEVIPVQRNDADSERTSIHAMKGVILDTVQKMPMSPGAMEAQRRKALVEAYKGVSRGTIEAIRDIYRQDFELFGYSTDVPT